MDDEDDLGIGAGGGGGGNGLTNADEDLSLPKATMAKLIADSLPADVSTSKEFRELVTECCVEFIHLISSEATEVCEKESKKTINGDHVIGALKSLGFDDYVDGSVVVLEEHQKIVKTERQKKSNRKGKAGGMSEEELLKIQQEMFAKSREKMAANN